MERKKERGLTCDLTYKDAVEILEIIDHSPHGELHLELEDLKLTVVKREGYGVPSTGGALEVRNTQRCGMTPENSGTKDTDDLKKRK
jgi:hypothetical protein